MVERRSAPRVSVSWPVRVAGISGRGQGSAINVSLSGVLFTTDADLEEKDLVILRIGLDAGTTVECVAQIVRRDNQDGSKLYGAAFRYLSAADRQKLNFALLLLREPSLGSRLYSRA